MISGRTTCIWASMRQYGVSVAVYAMVIRSLQCSLLLELNTSCLHVSLLIKISWSRYFYVLHFDTRPRLSTTVIHNIFTTIKHIYCDNIVISLTTMSSL